MIRSLVSALAIAVLMTSPALADVPERLDQARQLYGNGDLAKAAREIEMALTDLHAKMAEDLFKTLPPAPKGWEADQPQSQGTGIIGGGLTVSRSYRRDDSSLNLTLIMDNQAVLAMAALYSNPALAAMSGMKVTKVGTEDGVLRWDESARNGELSLVLANRVLLQIEGNEVDKPEVLIDLMKAWNIADVKKMAGI